MKILYVIDSLTHGGKERRLVSLIMELVKRPNIKIEIIILSEDIHYQDIFKLDVKVHFFKRNLKKDIKIFSKFNGVLRNFNPDIVHCWDSVAAYHFAPLCKLKNIPFINSMITSAPAQVSRFSKEYLSYAISYPFSDVILTNSQAGLYSFRVPKKKGKYIYNGIDFNRRQISNTKYEICKKFNIETDKIVGMTGAFYDRKDYCTFIKAAEIVLQSRRDVTFVAIGTGPNLEKIKGSVQERNTPNFKFVGKQVDVESIVNIFDIGVLSTYTEGISNAIMEYMIFEKPVIATEGGGTKELVVDNKTGYLVDQGNSKQLAEKILFLIENKKMSTEMGRKGRERIEKYFSIDKMIDKTLELYNNIK
jgi:glycosyltransferase involved in cell wall biosynthesis